MLISHMNRSIKRIQFFAATHVYTPLSLRRTTLSQTINTKNRRTLESLNEDQIAGLFHQLNFSPNIVKEHGLSGMQRTVEIYS